MKRFLSCDWGTSSFRLKLVDYATGEVIAAESSNEGISETFASWQNKRREPERATFYLTVLQRHVESIQQKVGTSLHGIPLIISGMASSSIGMKELPYKYMPFSIDGSDLSCERLEVSGDFHHPVYLISGVRSDDDVMRGEEIQLVGAATSRKDPDVLYIFPGTHSKHIIVNGGKAIAFKTFMTGEVFQLLSQKSILANSINNKKGSIVPEYVQVFKRGVEEGIKKHILNSVFHVRTNALFGKMTAEENYHYLSGLLIGSEISAISNINQPVTLVGSQELMSWYETAVREISGNVEISKISGDDAVVNGHRLVLRQTVS